MSSRRMGWFEMTEELFEQLLGLPDGCHVVNIWNNFDPTINRHTVQVVLKGKGLPAVREFEQIPRVEPVYQDNQLKEFRVLE